MNREEMIQSLLDNMEDTWELEDLLKYAQDKKREEMSYWTDDDIRKEVEYLTLRCKFCHKPCDGEHYHQHEWVCDACWDERLATTA